MNEDELQERREKVWRLLTIASEAENRLRKEDPGYDEWFKAKWQEEYFRESEARWEQKKKEDPEWAAEWDAREAEKERKDAEEKTRRREGVQAYYVAQSSDGIRCDHKHQTEAAAERCADELEIEHSLRKYGIVGALEHGLAAAEDESLREWKAVTVLKPQKKKQIKGVKT